MLTHLKRLLAIGTLLCAALCWADDASTPSRILTGIPVKEVTIFKDGYTFVLHEGALPTDAAGDVQINALPAPVIGTFWPYAADAHATLQSVISGQRAVEYTRRVQNMRELLLANTGAEAVITENGVPYTATIVGSCDDADALTAQDVLRPKDNLILLKTGQDQRAVDIGQIQNVAFKKPPTETTTYTQPQNLFTLQLNWGKSTPGPTANVGMVYLQRGIRWIPAYHVVLDGHGTARIQLQATVINELTDLQDVTANLVIGVPSFAFKDTLDPFALQQSVAQLSSNFRPDARTGYGFSNSIMSQVPNFSNNNYSTDAGTASTAPVNAPTPVALDANALATGKQEDTFVFTIKHLTLKQGERAVVPVASYSIPYRDVYTLSIPAMPPREAFQGMNNAQQDTLRQQYHAPKVTHNIRLQNTSPFPLTTAPALVFHNDQLVAQGLMTYTAIGGSDDLGTTTAVDIPVTVTDTETKRTLNARTIETGPEHNRQIYQYTNVELQGTITLRNHLAASAEIDVTRQVIGNVGTADHDGTAEATNVLAAEDYLTPMSSSAPYWWNWYTWPAWWMRLNGSAQYHWHLTVAPGQSQALHYTWSYYWQEQP